MTDEKNSLSRSSDIFLPIDFSTRGHALYYAIAFEAITDAFDLILHELESAVKCIPDPCEVVNVLSAFLQVNADTARARLASANEALLDFLEKK